jgi:hypothetical protein
VPEPDNAFDRNAVMVEIDGHTVGYLSRAEARRYQRRLLPLPEPMQVPAKLFGGTRDKAVIRRAARSSRGRTTADAEARSEAGAGDTTRRSAVLKGTTSARRGIAFNALSCPPPSAPTLAGEKAVPHCPGADSLLAELQAEAAS